MKIIQPTSPSDWEKYLALRYEVLREPWNQPLGSEILADDSTSLNAMIIDAQGDALGVARLHETSPGVGQVRCVAIKTMQQGKGLGKILMNYLENEAIKLGLREIILEARENAVPFYESLGYKITKKSYLLFDEIQHYTMEKEL
ncbi:GNAT family N-acetyltransferase [Sandaracinomonas limnophila]|uniref:GNAT family N-acetyltransferase n=1 Tax=Sandaracinomonas limnophila TaxID=1862386 RepID=A0A437PRZ2_9BACT|nr:GNAT family N-acetyltransferase [Sandaracinomonas limnophila]RVU25011.1 GNAT family N-acetyltransferase [Sandaracinomonas limnophila]